jgi:hypothetical protein
LPAHVRLLVVKIGARHRRPPLGLVIVIGPFVPELGVHVPEDPPMPFFDELGVHVPEDVPSMPFFDEFGVHVPEGLPSMPFFGFRSSPLARGGNLS